MTINPDEIRQEIEGQIAFLENAIQSVRNDQIQDISSLDGSIENICRKVTALDKDIATTFEQPIADMIGKLEELARELKTFQDRATAGEG